MTHTKGKWEIRRIINSNGVLNRLEIWAGGVRVCRLYDQDLATTANARLIAKAPEMAEALELAGEALGCSRPINDNYPEPAERHARAKEAIRALLSEIEREA